MSMIANLEELHRIGVDAFVELERERWTCPHCGALVSVHRDACLACGKSTEETHGTGLASGST
jgi:ribosomal protein S27AE